MKYIYTFLLSVLFSTSLLAQKVNYDNDSRWFWGLNAGGTWSKTDVRYKTDLGFGLMLGRQFNYNYGKKFSFDVRARYLTGLWKGYNRDSTSMAGVPAFSDYTTNGDPVILNYGTRVNELSLELAIHLNTLRERTGWDPYIFGGIGYTWYRTKGDLYDADGFTYVYDQTKLDGGYSQNEVMALTDKKFETNLNSPGLKSGFMPSVGIGIGYQVGKWFSIGVEHKTTFTLLDNFDGFTSSTGKYKNDWYHYTSAYLRFHIRGHYESTIRPQDSIKQPVTNDLNNPVNPGDVRPVLPIVDITNPGSKQITVTSPSYVLQGRIQHVASASNVVFRQNGNYNTNFSYNPSTQSFQSSVNLVLGQNTFELTGTNEHGSDADQVVIIYMQEDRTPPVVTYSNPSSSPTTVQSNVFNLTGTVLNVTGKDKITMSLNGVQVSNFSYNSSTKVISSNLNLVAGSNVLTTTGVNQFGTDSKTTTIIYQPRITIQPPVVYFTNPSINPYTVNQNTFSLAADVLNVEDVLHVNFKQNGANNHNFSFNPQTHKFTSNVVLIPGQNVFEIIGTNAAGISSASTILVYNYVAPKPPVVTITNPPSSPYETASQTFNLNATVLNVTTKNQIQVLLNGAALSTFNYNAASNGVTANLNLIAGSNYVTVTGTNADGTDSKQTVIIYKRVETVQPPVVQFTNPNVNPYTTSTATYSVSASVLHVTNSSGVNVNVNGVNISNFTFANNTVTFPVNLIEGANALIVTGTNSAGTATATQTIIYRKPIVVQPPVVNFIDPIVNPTTSFNATYGVKARVRYVNAANQITLKINGQASTNFTYVASSEMMEFSAGLANGSNVIEITATNNAGSDSKSTVINYKAPNPTLPPVVTITFPVSNPTTVSVATSPVVATVLNVSDQNQIQVWVNNQPFTGFTYATSTKVLNMTTNLNAGSNTIKITATNSAGTASDISEIVYKREEVVLPPTVVFTNPPISGQTVANESFVVKALVSNISAQSQLTLKHDGQVVNSTYWSFDAANNQVIYNVTLNNGNNVFDLSATNIGGTSAASTSIVYKKVEVPCLRPTVNFTNPTQSGISVDDLNYTVKALLTEITDINQLELYVNGNLQTQGTYDAGTKFFTKAITLVEGSNLIELKATNKCGAANASTVVILKPKVAPCLVPELTSVKPGAADLTVNETSISISVQASNVTAPSQLAFVVNGNPVNFSFDLATQSFTATVPLQEGLNAIKLTARNLCGMATLTWNITRTVCKAPLIQVTTSSSTPGGSVTADQVTFSGTISHVENQSDVTVKHNGVETAFVYNPQTGVLSVSKLLVMGLNTFMIQVKNNCGEAAKELSFTRVEIPAVRPTIVITNPSVSPFETTQAAQTVYVQTTGVTSASQVSITVNGVSTNFSFNNGSIQFNVTYGKGENTIVATAVTSGGSATDSKVVIFSSVTLTPAPIITLTNPNTCPAVFANGQQTITGTVSNISNASQVTITYNGTNVDFQSTISNGMLSFSFVVNITGNTKAIPLVITATNISGSASKTCLFSSSSSGNNGHGNNTDGVDESNPGQGVGGPNGGVKGSEDDENGNGSGSGNGGRVTNPIRPTNPQTTPSSRTPPSQTQPEKVVRPTVRP